MISPREGVVIAGRYTLLRPLARGGMGSVWVAHHLDLEVDVTVKFMAPALVASSDARQRFEREAKSVARLGSQHVVQVLDYGVEDETPFIVMELLRGESLWTRLAREGRLSVSDAARLTVQVCKALRTAHEAGLVHRDLKPGNVFLAIKDEDEVAIVLDFGIAKSTGLGDASAGTESGVLLGSAHYMSPEQIRSSRKVDHRSDLWSLAVILYRALTGRLPFPGQDFGDVLVRVCTDALPPASTVAPDLPATVDDFFERALARDPEQRFQSARELSEGFSAMALAAPPPSSGEPWSAPVSVEVVSAPAPAVEAATRADGGARVEPPSSVASVPGSIPAFMTTLPTLVMAPPAAVTTGDALEFPPEPLTRPLHVAFAPAGDPTLVSPARPAPRAPRRWPVWAALAAVAIVAILGVWLVLPATSAVPTTASAAPAAAPSAVPSSAPSSTARDADPAGSAPAASAAMDPGAPSRVPPRSGGEIIRRNPFAETGQAPTAKPKGAAPATKPTAPRVSGPLENSL